MDPQRVITRRFGAWFKKERKAAGLSVSVVARKLEIPEKTVLRWEAGSSLPNWENVARIYSVLQWRPPTELFDATRVYRQSKTPLRSSVPRAALFSTRPA